MRVAIQPFGSYHGHSYDEILVTNDNGQTLGLSDLGARITKWLIPSSDHPAENIVLGYPKAEDVFVRHEFYYGATVGRVAGRIKDARFAIDGTEYTVTKNDGANQNHGGPDSLDVKRWLYTIDSSDKDRVFVTFYYTDPAGTNGYPGELHVVVRHEFDNENRWTIRYRAETTAPTLCNLTNHVYFNLNGNNRYPVDNHQLTVAADDYLPLASDSLPLGAPYPVDGTAFDLNTPKRLHEVFLRYADNDLRQTNGFDHPWLLRQDSEVAATLSLPERGRRIEVMTDQPALVIYSHNADAPDYPLEAGSAERHAGITFEAQVAPDAIHHPALGNTILRPGETYRQTTSYRYRTD